VRSGCCVSSNVVTLLRALHPPRQPLARGGRHVTELEDAAAGACSKRYIPSGIRKPIPLTLPTEAFSGGQAHGEGGGSEAERGDGGVRRK
jgi:hypothetical protein